MNSLAVLSSLRISRLILFAVLTIAMVTSCAPAKKDENESPVLKAYRLIDENRTDEAIVLLEEKLAAEPENTEYKTTLASAYAHKGGFKVQKLVPVVNQAEKLEKIGGRLPDLQKPNTLSGQADVTAMAVAMLLNRFARVFDLYESIPLATRQQAVHLRYAISLLDELGPHLKSEDALYRAVLEVILLKHLLAETLVGEMVEPIEISAETCQLDLNHINKALVDIGKLLIDILNDFALANPGQAEEMKKRASDVSRAVADCTAFLNSTSLADEASQVLLKQAAIQTGFGKMLRCSGL